MTIGRAAASAAAAISAADAVASAAVVPGLVRPISLPAHRKRLTLSGTLLLTMRWMTGTASSASVWSSSSALPNSSVVAPERPPALLRAMVTTCASIICFVTVTGGGGGSAGGAGSGAAGNFLARRVAVALSAGACVRSLRRAFAALPISFTPCSVWQRRALRAKSSAGAGLAVRRRRGGGAAAVLASQ